MQKTSTKHQNYSTLFLFSRFGVFKVWKEGMTFFSTNFCYLSLFTFTTSKNTVISPNFLVWKLCGSCAFPQNFHTRKLGEITVFFVVYFPRVSKKWPNVLRLRRGLKSFCGLLAAWNRRWWIFFLTLFSIDSMCSSFTVSSYPSKTAMLKEECVLMLILHLVPSPP